MSARKAGSRRSAPSARIGAEGQRGTGGRGAIPSASGRGFARRQPIEVLVQRLPHAEDLPLPRYATPGAAGADLAAAVGEPITLRPMERRAIPTGLVIAVPPGHEAQVRPRSGLALRGGVTVANAPGTVDSDYRGELMVVLINLGTEAYTIRRGERIAQLVIAPVLRADFAERGEPPRSARGAGGFGSTGA